MRNSSLQKIGPAYTRSNESIILYFYIWSMRWNFTLRNKVKTLSKAMKKFKFVFILKAKWNKFNWLLMIIFERIIRYFYNINYKIINYMYFLEIKCNLNSLVKNFWKKENCILMYLTTFKQEEPVDRTSSGC